jgi:hypothetical protein
MRRSVLVSQMLITGLSAIIAFAETNAHSESELIPLKDIWAYDMPGTHDIQTLKPAMPKDLVDLIQQSLGRTTSDSHAKSGFVVQGDDKEALQTTYDVIVSGAAPKKPQVNQKTWIVFFSRDSGQYVHLRDVQRQDKQFTVRYRFVPHDSKEMTRHFALIPLGNLPAGSYRVSIAKSPMEQRYVDAKFQPVPESFVSKIVCKPFEFVVTENRDH